MIYGLIGTIIIIAIGYVVLCVVFRFLEEKQHREERRAIHRKHYEQEILKVFKEGTGLRRKDYRK